ncbi:brefeldin A-inhibited guanine nucleotide-exchange protein 5 [Tanacetum coccineum]
MLIDLYVNYDCDLNAPNCFEKMVTTLSRIAQGTQKVDQNSVNATQTGSIKGSSLQNEEQKSIEDILQLQNLKATLRKSKLISLPWKRQYLSLKHIKLSMILPLHFHALLMLSSNINKLQLSRHPVKGYVDSINFAEKLHTPILEFLRGFRLPGEAQKIYRIMENFAERYCVDNQGLFKNANTAYFLAYAVIMLNTDADNLTVWPKMTKTEFVRINATNDPEESAPTELMEEIYDSIVNEEMK